MPAFICPSCAKPFNVPAATSGAQGRCPYCRHAVTLPKTQASRWYYARAKKKYGPYTWEQLHALAQRGEFGADDMLLQEGTKQWVRAGTLPALFAGIAPPARIAPKDEKPVHRSFPWLYVVLAGIAGCLLIGIATAGYVYFTRDKPIDPPPTEKIEPLVEKKKKIDDPPENNGKEKKKPDEKKPKAVKSEEWSAQVIERLNRARKLAGLGGVTLDVELSRGAQAQAKNPDKADASLFVQEIADPAEALDRWMGALLSRSSLLAVELQTIGLGLEATAKGEWICVVDAKRGRGEPTVIVPAPKQTGVPLSFTGGPEVPDEKAAAGYPITVTFPPTRKVTAATLELRDAKDKRVDGWLWTPEKPVSKENQHNTIAFIPKGLLQSNSVYKVKSEAQIDGQPWSLTWSFTTEDDVDTEGVWAKKALAKVNGYRAQAGLKPVALDDALSQGCLAHARYLVINDGHPALEGLKAHDEDKTLPGYSEAGRAAGKASDIATGDYEPIDGVNSWLATLYHRIPILEPNLTRIGFGCARGRKQGWVTVMNVSSGRKEGPRPQAVFYPSDAQTEVPVSFPNSGEEPNPIPLAKSGRAGFPTTATFPQEEPLENATAKLTDAKGAEVACWFSSPEKPANKTFPQGTTVCLIPKAPLDAQSVYHVNLQGKVAGKAWQKKWKFTTGDAGQSVAAATRAVLDRLNYFRKLAGLNPVVLDETLSEGCQFHAEYLGKNAAVLAKRKSPENDEDPNLPGFTHEGLQAARNSRVFYYAPTPASQIDDAMAAFSTRVYLLNPNLQRIGFGCYHDVGRGWWCVLDLNRGRGDSRLIVRYPAPKQDDVPTVGFDRIDDAKAIPGFPISVAFPAQARLGKVEADLKDSNNESLAIRISTPASPINPKMPANVIGVHPLAPLQAGHTYRVEVSVIVNGAEWREAWQFTTAK